MKRMILMSEQELDVLINRAFFTGVCAQSEHKFDVSQTTRVDARFVEARDSARADLKRAHFERKD